jgi:hypothetical protein
MKKIYILTFCLLTTFLVSAQRESSFGISTHFGTFSLGKTETVASEYENNAFKLSRGMTMRQSIYFQKYISPNFGFSTAIGMHFSDYSLDSKHNYSYQEFISRIDKNLRVLEYGIFLPIKAHFKINTNWPTLSVGIIPSYNLKTISNESSELFYSIDIENCFGYYEKFPTESRFQMLYTSTIQYRLKTGTTFGVEYTTSPKKNTFESFSQVFSENRNETLKATNRYGLFMNNFGVFVAQELWHR